VHRRTTLPGTQHNTSIHQAGLSQALAIAAGANW
jgi:hypothetical protein